MWILDVFLLVFNIYFNTILNVVSCNFYAPVKPFELACV